MNEVWEWKWCTELRYCLGLMCFSWEWNMVRAIILDSRDKCSSNLLTSPWLKACNASWLMHFSVVMNHVLVFLFHGQVYFYTSVDNVPSNMVLILIVLSIFCKPAMHSMTFYSFIRNIICWCSCVNHRDMHIWLAKMLHDSLH